VLRQHEEGDDGARPPSLVPPLPVFKATDAFSDNTGKCCAVEMLMCYMDVLILRIQLLSTFDSFAFATRAATNTNEQSSTTRRFLASKDGQNTPHKEATGAQEKYTKIYSYKQVTRRRKDSRRKQTSIGIAFARYSHDPATISAAESAAGMSPFRRSLLQARLI